MKKSPRSDARRAGSLRRHIAVVAAGILLIGGTAACVTFTDLSHEAIPPVGPREIREIRSHVKAHLLDGSTILYRDGVTIGNGRVMGNGVRFDIHLDPAGMVSDIALDSVGAMESFRKTVDPVLTYLLPLVGTSILVVLLNSGE